MLRVAGSAVAGEVVTLEEKRACARRGGTALLYVSLMFKTLYPVLQ